MTYFSKRLRGLCARRSSTTHTQKETSRREGKRKETSRLSAQPPSHKKSTDSIFFYFFVKNERNQSEIMGFPPGGVWGVFMVEWDAAGP
jgi:hypothetical protein